MNRFNVLRWTNFKYQFFASRERCRLLKLLTLRKLKNGFTTEDKIVFISGSTAGIGFAIAQRFLQEGAQVIINGRTKESVDKAVDS